MQRIKAAKNKTMASIVSSQYSNTVQVLECLPPPKNINAKLLLELVEHASNEKINTALTLTCCQGQKKADLQSLDGTSDAKSVSPSTLYIEISLVSLRVQS